MPLLFVCNNQKTIFQLMNRIVIGNKNKPLNHIIPIADRINTVKIIELVFPDLNVKRGNLTK
tara:strand:- start:3 stop:188 length:186 start_codon:yes stop_codon:yes gene_type:complete